MVFVVFVRIKVNKKNRNCVTFVILKIEGSIITLRFQMKWKKAKTIP